MVGWPPDPATHVGKGYASSFLISQRKGLFLCSLHVHDFEKKGLFFA